MSTSPAFLQMDSFLDDEEYEALLKMVGERLDRMAPSSVSRPEDGEAAYDEAYRRSRVAMDLDDIWPLFEDRLMALLPHVRREVGFPYFELGSVERQMTAHGNGDFFAQHVDENHPGTDRSRALTFVYYFHFEPRRFSGGELRLYDTEDRGGVVHPLGTYTEVEPRANSIVFFAASASHEVMPVTSETNAPEGLRFTVNGWFRHAETGVSALPTPAVSTMTMLQQRLLPRHDMPEFAVRPVPEFTRDLLEGLWELRRNDVSPEATDSSYLPTGTPDFCDLGEIGRELLEQLRPLHEEWSGVDLESTAAYGLRVYRNGQTLARHTDRCESHVITSVVSVHQDVDVPWPLTLEIGPRCHDVVLHEGQMVTFESAAIPHGRTTPLRGRAYVILQLHYRPAGWGHDVSGLVRRGLDEGLIDPAGRPTVPLAAP